MTEDSSEHGDGLVVIKEDDFLDHPEWPVVRRETVVAILWDQMRGQFCCLHWPRQGWRTFVVGGVKVDEGEGPVWAARRELIEETGYTQHEFVAGLGKFQGRYLASHKQERRIANTSAVLFRLTSAKTVPTNGQPHRMHWTRGYDVPHDLTHQFSRHVWDLTLPFVT
jgi:8-oxo-dGTP pyrophosphatase MutT (NUDIX family)